MSEPALTLEQIVRTFDQGDDGRLEVLRGASLTIMPGEMVALVGPSGAGKSTLLHVAGLLELPQSGEILINGTSCGGLDDSERTRLRRNQLGFVYQSHHLLPEFSAQENIVLPQMIAGVTRGDAAVRANELLASVGLSARAHHRPGKMSGGEQQRVAIARGLANNPAILIADEPTGNLDPETADAVFAQLLALVREQKLAALMATHNMALAARMDRTLSLHNGQISSTET